MNSPSVLQKVASVLLVAILYGCSTSTCHAECGLERRNWVSCKGSLPTTDQQQKAIVTDHSNATKIIISECTFDTITNTTFVSTALERVKILMILCQFEIGGNLSLKLEPGALDHFTGIQIINLSYNNLMFTPENLFCSISGNLFFLTLTNNQLANVSQLGFGRDHTSKESSCEWFRLEHLKLDNNYLRTLAEDSFASLSNLKELLINGNELVAIHQHAFRSLDKLKTLGLSGNLLKTLPVEVFPNSLNSLDVSNNRLEFSFYNCLTSLQQLGILNASINHLSGINGDSLRNLSALHTLYLDQNGIATISDDTFRPYSNQLSPLYLVSLANNELSHVTRQTLRGLENVTILLLNNNRLTVEKDVFHNFRALQYVRLDGNNLTEIPMLDAAAALQELDISDNRISKLKDFQFARNNFLYRLALRNNSIEEITPHHFHNLTRLHTLDLSRNRICEIGSATFAASAQLVTLNLQYNALDSLEGIFPATAAFPALANLNLSHNVLKNLSWQHLPASLKQLSVSHNFLERLGEYRTIFYQNVLKLLDASHNQIHTLDLWSVPDSTEILLLANNRISTMDNTALVSSYKLQIVDLRHNRLEVPCLLWFVAATGQTQKRVNFFLFGNPLRCSCDTIWLNNANGIDASFMPIIADVDKLTCRQDAASIFNMHMPEEVTMKEAFDKNLFMCRAVGKRFNATCSCPDDGGQPLCWMECPSTCTCFHDKQGLSMIVDCSFGRWKEETVASSSIPTNVTLLRLDGNHIPYLRAADLANMEQLKFLLLNHSKLQYIEDGAFRNAANLLLLNVESNLLEELPDDVFNGLGHLKYLNLGHNKLQQVSKQTFLPLTTLKMLFLNGNRLSAPPDWILPTRVPNFQIILEDNPWSCNCDDMEQFRHWIQRNSNKVFQTDKIKCKPAEGETQALTNILDYNKTECLSIKKPLWVSKNQNVIIGTLASLLMLLAATMVIGFIYRLEILVLLYSRYGVRIFHKADNAAEKGKTYDAFISYCNEDESFIVEKLLPRLEGNRIEEGGTDGNYTLCLHQRDFAVGSYISDSIVEAVAQSRRTIVVLTNNFVESDWCRFEFQVAHYQMIRDRRQRLIVIVFGDIPCSLPPDIKVYLKTNTYLNWNDKLFWQKLHFAMPEKQGTS